METPTNSSGLVSNIRSFLQELSNSEHNEELFVKLMIGLTAFLVVGAWLFRPKPQISRFKEQKRTKNSTATPKSPSHDALAHDRLKKFTQHQLPGIQIDGQPHEILGVPWNATEEQIQKAYRDLMKQYHPDKVARPQSEQWYDAQEIANAINQARVTLLERLQRRKPPNN